jgi:hypothetical protein
MVLVATNKVLAVICHVYEQVAKVTIMSPTTTVSGTATFSAKVVGLGNPVVYVATSTCRHLLHTVVSQLRGVKVPTHQAHDQEHKCILVEAITA